MRFMIRCAWCNREMGEKVIGDGSDEVVITHSICDDCKARIDREIQEFVHKNKDTQT